MSSTNPFTEDQFALLSTDSVSAVINVIESGSYSSLGSESACVGTGALTPPMMCSQGGHFRDLFMPH